MKQIKLLRRVNEDSVIGGVCTGISKFVCIDDDIIRLYYLYKGEESEMKAELNF